MILIKESHKSCEFLLVIIVLVVIEDVGLHRPFWHV